MLDDQPHYEMNLEMNLGECDDDTIFSSPISSPLKDNEYYDVSYSSGMPNESLLLDDSINDFYNIGTVFENDSLSFGDQPTSPESCSDFSKSVKQNERLIPSKIRKRPRNVNKNLQRKKRKLNDGQSEIMKITLSRDELLSYTSKQFEEYVQKLEHNKSLSGEEKKELKRQRRLIKNRESAQASRQRKKNYIEELEKKVSDLTNENLSLRENVETLSKRSSSYEKKFNNSNTMLAKCILFKFFVSSVRFLTSKNKQDNMTHAKATGVVLLIMMFSFGFMLNPDKIIDDDMNRNMINSFGNLFETESTSVKSLTKVDNMVTVTSQNEEVLDYEDKKRVTKMKSKVPNEEKRNVKPKPTEVKKTNEKSVSVKMEEETNHTKNQDMAVILPEIKDWKPNTTYLLCNNVKQLTPPVPLPQDPTAPMILSLFIPPDSEELNAPGEKSMLEVTCKVFDLKVSRLPN